MMKQTKAPRLMMIAILLILSLSPSTSAATQLHDRPGVPIATKARATSLASPSLQPEDSRPGVLGDEDVEEKELATGEAGLSFRYTGADGVTGEPYLVDANHLNGPHSLALDSLGNLYVTEAEGQRLLKYDGSGTLQWSMGKAGIAGWDYNMLNHPLGVAVDEGHGRVYVADRWAHRIQVYDTAGNYVDTIGVTGQSGSDSGHFNGPAGVAVDDGGNLYVGDSMNHRIQIFDASGVYSATFGSGPGTGDYALTEPESIAFDSEGNVYVADFGNHRVQVYTPGLVYSTTLGVTGAPGSGNDRFHFPNTVLVDDEDRLYVVDVHNHRVQLFDDALKFVATLGEAGVSGSDDGHFRYPTGAAIDPTTDRLYVADRGNFRVQAFDGDLFHVDTIGTNGVPYLTDAEHLNYPADVAVDDDGHRFVVEAEGHRLLKLDSRGQLRAAVGTPGIQGSGNDRFSSPCGLALDSSGRVYVVDSDNHRIQIFDSDLHYLDTLGTGVCGTGNGAFCGPRKVAVDGAGVIYVADTANHRVQIFDSGHTHVATLGVTGTPGSDDGHFDAPQGVAVDGEGRVYVADEGNARVQQCTVFGSGGSCVTFVGETGIIGDRFDRLRAPLDVASDNESRIYVCDSYWNQRVQVFDRTGAYLTTVAGEWGQHRGQFRNPEGIGVGRRGTLYVADTENARLQIFSRGVPGWRQVNINGFGDNDNWAAWSLGTFEGTLYASTGNYADGADVYRFSAGSWERVASGGFGDSANVAVDAFAAFEGQLYASTWNDSGPASNGGQIWRSATGDSGSWERVVDDGFGDPTNGKVTTLARFEGWVYAGTWREDGDDHGAEVWRSPTGNNGSWARVVSDGFDGDSDNVAVVAMAAFGDHLYAATDNEEAGGEVWRTADGTTWMQTNADGFGDATNTRVASLAAFDGALYAGTWNAADGGQLWRSTSGTSWDQVMAGGFDSVANRAVGSLVVHDGHLYALTSNRETGPEVWHSSTGDEGDWALDVGTGFGCGATAGLQWDSATVVSGGSLFAATFTQGNAGGRIWQKLQQVYLPLAAKTHLGTSRVLR